MARRIQWLAALMVTAIAAAGCAATWDQAHRQDSHDDGSFYYDDFYDDFASYGRWVDVAPYGLVWCPEGVSSAWLPYTVGYWVATDDGWLWISEDPWGGIPYHYGRWAYDDDYGWIWVPGDVWAPAWVAWRYGSGWVGWAPLPPDVPWHVHVGIELSGYDLDRRIDTRYWSFTKAQDFGTHRKRVRVDRSGDKESLLRQTRNVTKYVAGPRPKEVGMRSDLIREIRDKKIERYRIVDSAKPVSKEGLRVRGKDVEVFRPSVDVKDLARARARAVKQRKDPDPAPRAIERSVRKREERSEKREDREKPVRTEAREEVKQQDRRLADARERPIAARREEAARERENTARAQPAREREQAAREREKADKVRNPPSREENVRQREERVSPRGRDPGNIEKSPPNRERDDREPEARGREKLDSKAEARQDAKRAPEGRGPSKGRVRGS